MSKNREREQRGETCIRHRKWCAGEISNEELHDEDVVDLVADALHFAASMGMDVDAILRMAKTNFSAEWEG